MPDSAVRSVPRNDVWTAIYLAVRDIERITGRSFESILDQYEGREEFIFIEALSCLARSKQRRIIATNPGSN